MELEYKIVQSTTPFFAKRDNLLKTLSEESAAGWELVEKFDNYKIRLQRDVKHRAEDEGRSIDPYRCQVGVSNSIAYGGAALLTLGIVFLIFRMVGTF
jgi:hypothetical protein